MKSISRAVSDKGAASLFRLGVVLCVHWRKYEQFSSWCGGSYLSCESDLEPSVPGQLAARRPGDAYRLVLSICLAKLTAARSGSRWDGHVYFIQEYGLVFHFKTTSHSSFEIRKSGCEAGELRPVR